MYSSSGLLSSVDGKNISYLLLLKNLLISNNYFHINKTS